MTRSIRAVATAAVVFLAIAPAVDAQVNNRFSIGAGASFPTGRFGDAFGTGYHVLAAIDFDRPASPLSFRLDGMFNEFEHETFDDASVRVFGLIGNAVIRSAPTGPYLSGGIGVYGTKPKGGDSNSDVGFNIGGGLRFELSGFSAFLEARFHQVEQNLRFVPVTFGVTF
jgi:hypothetical protein